MDKNHVGSGLVPHLQNNITWPQLSMLLWMGKHILKC